MNACDYGVFFFLNDTATTEIYTLSLHDALPIFSQAADNLIAVGFVPYRHRVVPAAVAEFSIGACRAVPRVRITERSMKFSSSRIFPGQYQLESFLMAAAGIDSICFCIRRPYFCVK